MKWLNLFGKVENHSQQLSRIGFGTFIGLNILFFLVFRITGELERGLATVAIPMIPGLPSELPTTILLSGMIALLFRIFHVHAQFGKLIKLRTWYEVRHILVPLAEGTGITASPNLVAELSVKRKNLMQTLFWKYADSSEPKIDKHLIESAFDLWGWAYIAIQISIVAFLLMPMLLYKGYPSAAGILCVVVLLLGLTAAFQIHQCIDVSRREVSAILADRVRFKKVQRQMNEIGARLGRAGDSRLP